MKSLWRRWEENSEEFINGKKTEQIRGKSMNQEVQRISMEAVGASMKKIKAVSKFRARIL